MSWDLLAFSAGFASGFLSELMADAVKQQIWSPTVDVEFQPTSEFMTREIETYPHGVIAQALFARVGVTNSGHSIAKNCAGYLVGVEQRPRGTIDFLPTSYREWIPLCWSYLPSSMPQRVDLPRGAKAFLNIASTRDINPTLRPELLIQPHQYQVLFNANNDFRYQVVIACDGAEPKRLFVEVARSGPNWDDISVRKHELLE